jgi:2-oxoglutarate dehydrogenase E2 component (dihydrolipoamide succinyltransferase)
MSANVQVPTLGESVTEAVISQWLKKEGDHVAVDEPICELESDKATVDLPSPAAGVLHQMLPAGETAHVGDVIARIDGDGAASAASSGEAATSGRGLGDNNTAAQPFKEPPRQGPAEKSAAPQPRIHQQSAAKESTAQATVPTQAAWKVASAAPSVPPATIPSEKPQQEERLTGGTSESAAGRTSSATPPPQPSPKTSDDGSRRAPMTKIRRSIAERLVRARQTTAMLTTFNEIDMTAVQELRARYKERLMADHGVSLGLVSLFARATVLALEKLPVVNAQIDGDDIVYHDHVNLGIAVSTDRGLLVPVLHNAERLSIVRIEQEIKRLAAAARDGKLSIGDLSGGTFTITNGGVFGSLLSTPILHPPQSGILGLHTIQDRPVAINRQVEIRPMMYVALSYDHRLVDGHDAVSFLVHIKRMLEDPMQMVLGV